MAAQMCHQVHVCLFIPSQGARRLVEPILPGNVSMSSVHLASTPAGASTASATDGNAAATGLTKALSNTRASGGGSLNGSGTLVCVVDTGVNFSNDLYGNCYGVNQPQGQCKVVAGYDFVGDAYNGRLDGPPAVRGGPPVSSSSSIHGSSSRKSGRGRHCAACTVAAV